MFLNKTIINSRKKSDDKNFAGGLMSEKFNYLSLARITKLSLALYRKLISMGMHIILQSLVLVSKMAQFKSYAAGLLRKTRRQRKRERHQTIGLKSKTIAVHVRYNSWYISLPSSTKQQREMTKFYDVWRT